MATTFSAKKTRKGYWDAGTGPCLSCRTPDTPSSAQNSWKNQKCVDIQDCLHHSQPLPMRPPTIERETTQRERETPQLNTCSKQTMDLHTADNNARNEEEGKKPLISASAAERTYLGEQRHKDNAKPDLTPKKIAKWRMRERVVNFIDYPHYI